VNSCALLAHFLRSASAIPGTIAAEFQRRHNALRERKVGKPAAEHGMLLEA
jgi:hypothetical protein